MKPTSPRAGATSMHAPATVLRNRCGSAEPSMNNLLVVDPYVQGKTLLRADRYSNALPDLPVQVDVLRAVRAGVDEPGLLEVLRRARGGVVQPERGGQRGDVQARRRGHVLLERV